MAKPLVNRLLDQETLMVLLVDYGYGAEEYLHAPNRRCVSTSLNPGDYEGLWALASELATYCGRFDYQLPEPVVSAGSQGIRVFWPSMDDEELFPREEREHDWDDLED